MDTTKLLGDTDSEFKTLLARLNRIVTSGDAMHAQIYEKTPKQDFEIFDDLNLYLKLRLREKNPPCTIRFIPERSYHDMKIYTSTDNKRPSEHSHQAVYSKGQVIVLNGTKVSGNYVFKEEWLYLCISSTQGCKFNVNVSFKPAPIKRKTNADSGIEEKLKAVSQMPGENEDFNLDNLSLASANLKDRQKILESFISNLQADKKSFQKFRDGVKKAKQNKMQRGVHPDFGGRKNATQRSQQNKVVAEFYHNATSQEQYDFIYRNTYIMPLYKEYNEQQQYFKQMLKNQKTQSVKQRRE